MSETENTTSDAVLDDEQEEENEVGTYEVQWSMKWVNFNTVVEAKDKNEALKIALKSYKENGLKDFTVTANNEEVDSLEGIFDAVWHPAEVNRV